MAYLRAIRSVAAASSLAIFLLLALCLAASRADSGPTAPGIRYVVPDGSDSANLCLDPAQPCATVQHAVDVAAAGDEIRIASGAYTDVHARPAPVGYQGPPVITQVVYVSKTLILRGGYTTSNWLISQPDQLPTLLDAQGRGRVFWISGAVAEPISVTLAGLWLTNGSAAGLGGAVFGNDAGGGIGALNVALDINHSRIFSNTATLGGGFWLGRGGRCTLNSNRITANTAANGGGLLVGQSEATLRDNFIGDNAARQQGGGALILYSSATLANNAIVSNRALINVSGLGLGGTNAELYHTTVNGNTGGDGSGVTVNELVSIPSHVSMENTLLANQSVGITVGVSSAVQMDGLLWFANTLNRGGMGTITAMHVYTGNPRLAADGYHLGFPSAAIDRGVAGAVDADIDGNRRPVGPAPDLGAVEYQYEPVYLPFVSK